MWVLAIFVATAASRYFFLSQKALRGTGGIPTTPEARAGAALGANALRDYPLLFLPHVGGGIVALLAGLPQFSTRLRLQRPKLHRRLGLLYVIAVAVAAICGLPLALLIPSLVPREMARQFVPMSISFFVLAIAWGVSVGVAYMRVRAHRYREHRAWMMRSYALTFAAVTVRLVAALLAFATGDVVLAVTAGVMSWPANLIVTEWLIQRREPVATDFPDRKSTRLNSSHSRKSRMPSSA